MPVFISQGRYTQDAIKGMLAKPEDREAAVRQLWDQAGAKLLAFYMTFGEYDWLTIGEGEWENVTAALVAAAAGGSITDMRTMAAMTASDMKEAFAKAGPLAAAFKSAGK
jgi:uncharacterized protein with GYD domain